MIRLCCPSCGKTIGIADANAGKVGLCPYCKNKVRIPTPDDAPDVLEEIPEEAPPRRQRIQSSPPAKKRPQEDEDFEVVEDDVEEDEPPRRPRRDVDDRIVARRDVDDRIVERRRSKIEEADEDEDEPPRRKRRKKRRRRSGSSAGLSPLLIGVMVVGGIGFVCAVLSFVVPAMALVTMGLGYLLQFTGGIMFLVVAFQDDTLQGILCLFVPCYSLFYLISHFEEEKIPFLINIAGFVMVMIGGAAGGQAFALR
jgi:hypothetical protein